MRELICCKKSKYVEKVNTNVQGNKKENNLENNRFRIFPVFSVRLCKIKNT